MPGDRCFPPSHPLLTTLPDGLSYLTIVRNIYRNYHNTIIDGHIVRDFDGCSLTQTWKMPELLPEQDCSFQDFTPKGMNYVNFKIAAKKRNSSANTSLTTFTSLPDGSLISKKQNKN